jgi:hypothetical protein
MRALTLLLCLPLAGCAGMSRLSNDPEPAAMTAPAAAAPAPAVAAAAAPAASPPPAPGPRDTTEAKVICWGKVEREKQRVRTIDQRIAYVERCVAEQMKAN